MSLVTKGTEQAKTVTFPGTVRRVGECAFRRNTLLRSVILNEGLEALGECRDQEDSDRLGIFDTSKVRRVVLPSTLKALGDNTFQRCGKLARVVFAEGSRLERIGSWCFDRSGVEELALPRTLKTIGVGALIACRRLRTIYLDDGCAACLSRAYFSSSVDIVLRRETAPLGETLQGLRKVKNVVVPEGVERIGSYWFRGSDVQSVVIPDSVREIGAEAFCACDKLRRVTFGKGGKVSAMAENGTGAPSVFSAPQPEWHRLKKICDGAFHDCSGLKFVALPNGLAEIGASAFENSGLESIAMPPSVRVIRQGAFCNCHSLRKAALNEGLETLGADPC